MLTSAGADGRTYEMRMGKGDPRLHDYRAAALFPERGTEVTVQPLLPGIRNLSGKKSSGIWHLNCVIASNAGRPDTSDRPSGANAASRCAARILRKAAA